MADSRYDTSSNMRSLSILLLAGSALAQHPESVQEGRRLFVRNCSACHGDTAKGGRAPDLTSGEWKHGGTATDLVRNMTKGIPGTQMPAFPMPNAEAEAIASFLLSLSGRPGEPVTGNDSTGRQLFFGKGRCSTCHLFGGNGGTFGGDLSNARARWQPSALSKRMSEPIVLTEATVRGRSPVRGVKRGEDTFTMQLFSSDRQWQLLNKRELAGDPADVSEPHPALSEAERLDVAAFLLKTEPLRETPGAWTPDPKFNVTFARLRNAAAEPQNWLTYWGDLRGTHYSGLRQITPANVTKLQSAWTFQSGGDKVETTPLVVDGLMFATGPLNNAAAIDARTGRALWRYTRRLPPNVASHCTVMTNRGFAILGDRLYMATLDTHLVSLDAKTGSVIWDVAVDDYAKGFSITHAPLAIDGKIIVGVTSGECALTGWVDAYDAATGKRLWRTYSTPRPGDPNRKTWSPEPAADYGGSPTWMTGTFDVETNTLFWMTGNPGPDYDGTVRAGDNLYSCSVLALDPETGRMKWWFQFTPHDVHDWDANETPVLIDGVVRGQKRKLLITAQRNAFYYVLDRTTGEFLEGRAFARQTWASGLDDKGRPIVLPNTTPTPEGNYVCPDAAGSANWGSPSYDPVHGHLVVSVREACAVYTSMTKDPVPGAGYTGGGVEVDPKVGTPGAIRALEAATGKQKWNFPIHAGASSTGVLGTAGGVVFASSNDGNLIALDSASGKYLWHYNTGAATIASPIAFAVDGKQYVAIASQSSIFAFALP